MTTEHDPDTCPCPCHDNQRLPADLCNCNPQQPRRPPSDNAKRHDGRLR